MKDVDRMGNTMALSWLNVKTGGKMGQRSSAEKEKAGSAKASRVTGRGWMRQDRLDPTLTV